MKSIEGIENNMKTKFADKGIENDWGQLHAFYCDLSFSGGPSQFYAAYSEGIYMQGVKQKNGVFVHRNDVLLKIRYISKNILNIRHCLFNNGSQDYLDVYISLDNDDYRESLQDLIAWYSLVLSSRQDDIEGFNRFTYAIDFLNKKYNLISDRINLNTIEISDFFLGTDDNLIFGRDREKGDLLIYYVKLGNMPCNYVIEYDKFGEFNIEKNIDDENQSEIWTGYSLTSWAGNIRSSGNRTMESHFKNFETNSADQDNIVIRLKNNVNIFNLDNFNIVSSPTFIKLPIRYYGILKELYSEKIGDLL
jgi:hypothetical protein